MPICSANRVDRRPMRSMCAPVSSSRNSTAIDRRRTVSVCAISSSDSARRSSCERPSISSSSAVRRLSPTRQPSVTVAAVSTAMQTPPITDPAATIAPTSAASATSARGAHSIAGLTRLIPCSDSLRRRGGLGDWPTPASLPRRSPEERGVSGAFRLAPLGDGGAPSRRVCEAPRRAGRRKLAWITPLTGNTGGWTVGLALKHAFDEARGALEHAKSA